MGILNDLLSEVADTVVTGALWPSSARGELVLLAVAGLGFSCMNGWLVLSHPHPVSEWWWGFGALVVVGLVFGSAGSLLSGLHLVRGADHRVLAGMALVLNVTAVAISLVAAL